MLVATGGRHPEPHHVWQMELKKPSGTHGERLLCDVVGVLFVMWSVPGARHLRSS